MALPTKKPRVVKPQPQEAPKDATARTPSTGQPQEGFRRASIRARADRGSASRREEGWVARAFQVDFANFCCPEYLLSDDSTLNPEQTGRRTRALPADVGH